MGIDQLKRKLGQLILRIFSIPDVFRDDATKFSLTYNLKKFAKIHHTQRINIRLWPNAQY